MTMIYPSHRMFLLVVIVCNVNLCFGKATATTCPLEQDERCESHFMMAAESQHETGI